MTEYVCGFLFDLHRHCVVLIEKKRPAWQAGKWNGVGGHIEPTDESPLQAMRREFLEETGLLVEDWEHFCTITGRGFQVRYYRSFSDEIDRVRTTTDEEVDIHLLTFLPKKKKDGKGGMVANCGWLIEMALSMDGDSANSFEIQEVA